MASDEEPTQMPLLTLENLSTVVFDRVTPAESASIGSCIVALLSQLGVRKFTVRMPGDQQIHIVMTSANAAEMLLRKLRQDGSIPFVRMLGQPDTLPKHITHAHVDCGLRICPGITCPFHHTGYPRPPVCRYWNRKYGFHCFSGRHCGYQHPGSALWHYNEPWDPWSQGVRITTFNDTDVATIWSLSAGSFYSAHTLNSDTSSTDDTTIVLNPCTNCEKESAIVVMIPCGHVSLCMGCARKHQTSFCPVCSNSICGQSSLQL